MVVVHNRIKKRYNLNKRVYVQYCWLKELFSNKKSGWTEWDFHSTYNSLRVLSMVKDDLERADEQLTYKTEYQVVKNKK